MHFIANTIILQIVAQDKWALSAWGTNNIKNLPSGVQFNIRTPLYSEGATLEITLNEFDTYDMHLYQRYPEKIITLSKINDIYFDSLIESIDSMVEGDRKRQIFF